MNYLLDTNVVSEWVKPRPDSRVIHWLDQADEDRIFLSVISIAELTYGAERLQDGRRKQQLLRWLEQEIPDRFGNRLLPVGKNIADVCGKILARADALGRPIAGFDAFIAATSEVHGLTLVTRNNRQFSPVLKHILNPWQP